MVKEIGNECSDKDLNENIDWCIQTLSFFDVTDLNKKELCETLESQKAMIVMHDTEIRNKTIEEIRDELLKHRRDICMANNPFNFIDIALDNVRKKMENRNENNV